ncbi:hypothetical protein C2E23DRAFT_599430 [Lenzites betulinus]|nr:hypothetical protein C2E23DRAFT_599430 [Lenzites betulinus]
MPSAPRMRVKHSVAKSVPAARFQFSTAWRKATDGRRPTTGSFRQSITQGGNANTSLANVGTPQADIGSPGRTWLPLRVCQCTARRTRERSEVQAHVGMGPWCINAAGRERRVLRARWARSSSWVSRSHSRRVCVHRAALHPSSRLRTALQGKATNERPAPSVRCRFCSASRRSMDVQTAWPRREHGRARTGHAEYVDAQRAFANVLAQFTHGNETRPLAHQHPARGLTSARVCTPSLSCRQPK